MNNIDDVQKPVGKFAQFTDGIWREVTAGSAGVPLYARPPAADVQKLVEPVALEKVYETIVQWDKGGGKRSRRELAKQIIDLYINPPTADVSALVEALQYVIRGVPDTWDGVIKAKEVLSKWEGK
jgi:hypothetical protein